MSNITSLSEYKARKPSMAMTAGLRAVVGMNEPSFVERYRNNYEAMYFCMKGTIRAYREQQKKVMIDPSIDNMLQLQELSDAIDEFLGHED